MGKYGTNMSKLGTNMGKPRTNMGKLGSKWANLGARSEMYVKPSNPCWAMIIKTLIPLEFFCLFSFFRVPHTSTDGQIMNSTT